MNDGDPGGELMAGAPVQDDFWATHAPNQPTSSGRMYISPIPVPTLSPDDQADLQARMADATSGPARTPIAPPAGMMAGVTMPDMGTGIRAAFARLPVEQAVKAIETAMQYQGQRGFQQDTQNGMPAPQAMAKWGPMLFGRSQAGMATALRLGQPPQVPQMTPAQVAANQIAQRSLALREAAARKTKAPSVMVPIDPNNPDAGKITGPADSPEIQSAMKKMQDLQTADEAKRNAPPEPGVLSKARNFLFGTPGAAPASNAPTKAPGAAPFKEGALIRSKKDGKLYRVINGVPVLEEGQ